MWAPLDPTAITVEHDVARPTSEGAALSRQEAVTLARTAIDLALARTDTVSPGDRDARR